MAEEKTTAERSDGVTPEYTYEIVEHEARVWRLLAGVRLFWMSFADIQNAKSIADVLVEPDTHTPDAKAVMAARQMYMIARDELLERGLIDE